MDVIKAFDSMNYVILPCNYNHKIHDVPHVPQIASSMQKKACTQNIAKDNISFFRSLTVMAYTMF